MATFDLDALLALDPPHSPHEIIYRGETWFVPPDLPFEVLKARGELEILLMLLEEGNAGQLDRFYALRPRPLTSDVKAFSTAVLDLYGVTLGESPASPAPSPDTSERVRPTSNGSTASTSAKRARSRSSS